MLKFPKEENMKSVNYTPEMEQAIREASKDGPLNIAKARVLAEKLGRKPRSITAKAISMKVPYDAAKPTRKDGTSPAVRKADLVEAIEKALAAENGSLDGLVKSTRSALVSLLSEIG
jgi:hypothetical protein